MFRTLWHNLSRRHTRPVRPTRRSTRPRLAIEALETRCLMSLQASPVAAVAGVEGQTTTAAFATFTDTDATLTPSSFTVNVNFGDSTTPVTVVPTQTSPTTYSVTASHLFAEEAGSQVPPGAFNVTVTVTDNVNALTSSAITQAQIADATLSPGNTVNPTGTLPTPTAFTGGDTGDATSAAGGLANFEAAIGGVNNAGGPATTSGFRTINWDGVKTDGTDFGGGANTTVIVPGHTVAIPLNRFQSRGVFFSAVYAVSNDGFADVNPSVAGLLPAFSKPSTFAMFNEKDIDFKFVLPSGPTSTLVSAASRGFGVIFINVTLPGTTMELFNGTTSLGVFNVPVGGKGQPVFLGELFNSPLITSATLSLGTDVLFNFDGTTVTPGPNSDDGVTHNLVTVDDWAFAEPQPIANGFPIVSGAQGTANAQPTITASPGVPFTGVVATFSDSDPSANAKDFTATINWGDGHSTNGTITADPAGGFDVSGTNTYSVPGTFPINVDILDFGGAPVLSVNNTAKVVDAPLQVMPGSIQASVGTPFTGAVAAFTDPDPGGVAGDYSATISWGDGNVSAGTVTASGGTFVVSGTNFYAVPGRFTVSVTVFDEGHGAVSTTTSAIVGTANERLVGQLFHDLLGRNVDPAGLALWAGVLNGGGSTAQVVQGIEGSSEFRNTEVNDLFKQLLHRTADSAGLDSFSNFLAGGGTVEQVADMIASSPEYFQVRGGGTNDGFLTALYADALGRSVDAGSRTAFDNVLNGGGSRQQVATAIFGSLEFMQDLVHSFYQKFLHRAADSTGLSAAVSVLQGGGRDEQVILDIVSSPEYAGLV
jgi:hypothetical protein